MALDDASGSSATPFPLRTGKPGPPIPSKLFRIPPDQKALLDSPNSWASVLQNSKRGLVNVPDDTLESLVHFHHAHVPPPAAQGPSASSTSAPTNSANDENGEGNELSQDAENNDKKGTAEDAPNRVESSHAADAAKDQEDEDDEDEASQVSWPDSPPSLRSRLQGPAEQEPVTEEGATSTGPPASSADSPSAQLSQSLPPDNASPSKAQDGNSDGESESDQGVRFASQPPMPNLADGESQDLSLMRSNEPPAPPPQATDSKRSSSTPQHAQQRIFPPSSSAPEELEMEIPGALVHATPSVNRAATQVQKAMHTTPAPPCGQDDTAQSTNAEPTSISTEVSTNAESLVPANEPKSSAQVTTKLGASPSTKKRMKVIVYSDDSDQRDGGSQADGADEADEGNVLEVKDTPFYKALLREPVPVVHGPGPASQQSVIPSTFPTRQPGPVPEETLKEEVTELPGIDSIPEAPMDDRRSRSNAEGHPAANIHRSQGYGPVPARSQIATSTASPSMLVDRSDKPNAKRSAAEIALPRVDKRFEHSPLETFCRAYSTFRGSLDDFVRACMSAQSLQTDLRLPAFLYDDFIRAFCDGYMRYVEETEEVDVLDAMEWYVENVTQPKFNKGIVTTDNIGFVFDVYAAEYEAARQDLSTIDSVIVRRTTARSHSGSPTAQMRNFPSVNGAVVTQAATSRQTRGAETRPTNGITNRSRPQNFGAAIPTVERDNSPPPRSSKRRKTESPSNDEELPSRSSRPVSGPMKPASNSNVSQQSMQDGRPRRQLSDVFLSRDLPSSPPVIRRVPDRAISNGTAGNGVLHEKTARAVPARRVVSATTAKGKEPLAAPPPRPSLPNQPATPSVNGHGKKPTSRVLPRSFTNGSRQNKPQHPAWAETVDLSSPAPSVLTQASGVSKSSKKMSKVERYKAKLQEMVASGRLPGRFEEKNR